MEIQLSQHRLRKTADPIGSRFAACVRLSLDCHLCPLGLCLAFCWYHTVLVMAALKQILKLGTVGPLNLFILTLFFDYSEPLVFPYEFLHELVSFCKAASWDSDREG